MNLKDFGNLIDCAEGFGPKMYRLAAKARSEILEKKTKFCKERLPMSLKSILSAGKERT